MPSGFQTCSPSAPTTSTTSPYCRETWSVLVTNNVRDFNASDLAPEDHAGIVVVHDKERPPADIAGELHRITSAYPSREAFRGFESADDWSTD